MNDMIQTSKTNNGAAIFAASYWPATRRAPAGVTIDVIQNGKRRLLEAVRCDDKRDARKIAARYNATHWNF